MFTVYPTNSLGAIGNAVSTQITIMNSKPIVFNLSINPNPASAGDLLSAAYNVSDPDGHPVTCTFEWIIDGQTSSVTSSSLQTSPTSMGSSVQLIITPFDGIDYGTPETVTITLQ